MVGTSAENMINDLLTSMTGIPQPVLTPKQRFVFPSWESYLMNTNKYSN